MRVSYGRPYHKRVWLLSRSAPAVLSFSSGVVDYYLLFVEAFRRRCVFGKICGVVERRGDEQVTTSATTSGPIEAFTFSFQEQFVKLLGGFFILLLVALSFLSLTNYPPRFGGSKGKNLPIYQLPTFTLPTVVNL